MKILIITGNFFPTIVGSGIATYIIANELSKRGHDVTAVVDQEYSKLLKGKRLPFKVCCIPGYSAFITGDNGFREATAQIHSKLAKLDFDVIHVFNYLPMLLFSLMRDSFNAPVVFTFWNTPYKSERAIGFYESPELDVQLARSILSLKKYDSMVLGSKCSYKSALMLGANPKKTSFRYHGIDLSQFKKDLDKYRDANLNIYLGNNLKDDDILITLPGRITERKGMIEAIYALQEVNKHYHVKLLLTGMLKPYSKNFADNILNTAQKLEVLDQLLVPLITIPRHFMPAIYKRSNIVITPSYYEGLGFTAIEALATGRPLIATNVPGLNEVGTNRKNCIMIPPRDSKSLARAILELLENPRLANRLSEAGPESVKKFDMKPFVVFLLQEYDRLIKNRK